MKYLSLDLEATGLEQHDLIIELACIAFDAREGKIERDLSFHRFVQCPPFEELKAHLNPWVIKNNKELITKANLTGVSLETLKEEFKNYLTGPKLKSYFGADKITLFGKSMAAIDLPFLHRDLGEDFMKEYFEHRQLDLSSVAYYMVDRGILPQKCTSGSELMKELGFGEVAHTALEDAINTAQMYLTILRRTQGQAWALWQTSKTD